MSEQGYIYMKGWDRFQHYRDRRPPWIKNYVDLLHDESYRELGAPERALLHGLWMLAAVRGNGRVSASPGYLRSQLMLRKLPLNVLVNAGWITIAPDRAPEEKREWASRYVADDVRDEVIARTDGRCAKCGSSTDIEIDHIIPVSRGGTGDKANLQALCRPCNRRKHNQYAEQGATQTLRSVLTETETDGSIEPKEKERARTAASGARPRTNRTNKAHVCQALAAEWLLTDEPHHVAKSLLEEYPDHANWVMQHWPGGWPETPKTAIAQHQPASSNGAEAHTDAPSKAEPAVYDDELPF